MSKAADKVQIIKEIAKNITQRLIEYKIHKENPSDKVVEYTKTVFDLLEEQETEKVQAQFSVEIPHGHQVEENDEMEDADPVK